MLSTRHRLVAEMAPGRSFLDLGGMFGIAGDVAFRAESAGASKVLLFDGMDPSDEFRARVAASAVHYRQGDLHDPADIGALGTWDVVWCAGVIYHSPDPFRQLLHLRSITRERLLLGSHVVPEVPGIENACVFYPGRSSRAQSAFARLHGDDAFRYPGASGPFDRSPLLGYGNMWWGFTPSSLRALLDTAGFRVLEEYRYSPVFMDIVAEPGPEPDFIPSLGFSRARGEAGRLAAGHPDWWESRA